MGRNLRLGLEWISGDGDKPVAYRKAVEQMRYAAERERSAAASIAQIHPASASLSAAIAQSVAERETQALREIDAHYRAVTRGGPPAARAQDGTERELSAMRPAVTGGPKEFLNGRNTIAGVPGLHGLMGFELLNLVDGRRTGLEIYRYLAAEAREAGDHYFGVVTPAAVLQYLKNAATAGMIRTQ